jgi:serine/threonine protein kinase/tetratricopeptide (TPR) repeat protein
VIGKRLSHYVIIEQVGAGGMGVVYRARDERLDRDVALKILSPSLVADDAARKRLRREALVLSKLNHAHINLIYDVDSEDGVDFLVMEFIRGETLSRRLEAGSFSEPDVLSIGIQVAEALEEAHRSGIVHRDLKPGNVMLTERGVVKVLDFGLAKALESDHAGMESLTEAGHVAGTLPYIAPEQFRGARVDARSDIYSLGAVLYEIATGVRAFAQETTASLIDAILKDSPKNPSAIVPRISPGLEGVILKSLAKDPDLRYGTAGEVVDALQGAGATRSTLTSTRTSGRRRRWVIPVAAVTAVVLAAALVATFLPGGGAHPKSPRRIESLAVLPLDDLSGDSKQGYFADGMTDALITRLAQISSLRVISRTSVMRYRGGNKSLPQIARELHVDAVVEGTVLHSGNKVRISAELVDAAADRHLWANTYEREVGDVIALQRDLAAAIADQVNVRLTSSEREGLARADRVNPQAYDEYLKGRQEWATRTATGLEAARRNFLKAADIDPRFAQAYAGLADVYVLQDTYSGSRAEEALPLAEDAARKALAIDGRLAEAYPALGLVKLYSRWDWAGAEADFKHAIELRPNYATAHHWYSILLRDRGRFDEAISEARRALELDPLSSIMNANLGDTYFFARRYADAIRQHRIGRDLDPSFAPTHLYLAMAFAQNGDLDSAIVACQTARALSSGGPYALGGLGYVLARAGRGPDAERILDELQRFAVQGRTVPFDMSLVWMGLAKGDRALEWIDKARRKQPSGVKDLGVDPRFDPLREDPRFRKILRELGLG